MATLANILTLEDDDRELTVHLDLLNRSTGLVETLYYSTKGFVSAADESQGVTWPAPIDTPFPALIKSAHEFNVSVMEPRMSGQGASSFGPIELINHDDGLSHLLKDYSWDGREIRVFIGEFSANHDAFQLVSRRSIAGEPSTGADGNILIESQDWRARGLSCQPNKFEGYDSCVRYGDAGEYFQLQSKFLYNILQFEYALTIEFRFRTYGTKNSGSVRNIIGKPLQWNFSVNASQQLQFRLYGATDYYTWRVAAVDIDTTTIEWKNVALRIPAGFDITTGNPTFLLNGDPLAILSSSTAAVAGDPLNGALRMGGSLTGGYVEGEFDIDELRIWERGRYSDGIKSTNDGPIWAATLKLWGYWRCDENFGSYAYPESQKPENLRAITYAVGGQWKDRRRKLPDHLHRKDVAGFEFDGVDDRIQYGPAGVSKLDLATAGEFTLNCCFVLGELPSVRVEVATLIRKDLSYRMIINTSDVVQVAIYASAAWRSFSFTSFTPIVGQKYTLAVDFDDATDEARLWWLEWSRVTPYETGTIAGSHAIADSTAQFICGASTATTDRFEGWMGYVGVWDTKDVDWNSKLGDYAHYINATASQYSNLILEYRMIGYSGSTVADSGSGTAGDGTFNGVSGTLPASHGHFIESVGPAINWVGTGTGPEWYKGEDRPQCYGDNTNFEPVHLWGGNVDSRQIYEVHDNEIQAFEEVRESGDDMNFTTDVTDLWSERSIPTGQYRTDISRGLLMTNIPSGELTCDFTGHDPAPNGYITTTFEIMSELADKSGLDISAMSWTENDRPNEAHFFSRFNAPRLDSTLDFLARSISAYWILNRENQVVVGLFDVPSEWVSDYEVTDDDIVSVTTNKPLTVSNRERIRYGQIGTTQSARDLDSTIDPQERYHFGREWRETGANSSIAANTELGSEEFITDTALTERWYAHEEAERRIDLYGSVRRRIKVVLDWTPIVKSMWFTVLPGEVITVKSSRYDIGTKYGSKFIITSIKESYRDRTMELELWGGTSAGTNIEPTMLYPLTVLTPTLSLS